MTACRRAARAWRAAIFAAAMTLVSDTPALSAAEQDAGSPPLPDTTLFLELVVNGVATGRVVAVRHQGGRFLVHARELDAVGVRTGATGDNEVALGALPDIRFRYDSHVQRLEIVVPAEWLPPRFLGRTSLLPRVPARTSLGAVFNYDVLGVAPAHGARYVSAWTEQRLFDRWGTISNTGVLYRAFDPSPDLRRRSYLRYDTRWNYVDEARLLTVTAGDLITGAVTWTSPVRFGGISIERNFTMRPDIVTYPLPEFAGLTAVPTAVDLFINGSRVLSESVAPGPFVMNTVPLVSGAGEATVVTTDAVGRRTSTTVPFYVANDLLRKGYFEYSASAGLVRRTFGLASWGYGGPAASGIIRRGITDALTLTGHAEGGEGLAAGGAGADLRIHTFGVLGVSASRGGDASGRGNQYGATYTYAARRYSFMARHLQRDVDFADLSAYDRPVGTGARLTQRSDQLTAAATPPGLGGTIGSSYIRVTDADGQRSRFINVSFSRRFLAGSSIYLSMNRALDQAEGTSMQVQIVRPFGSRGSATGTAGRSAEAAVWGRLQYSRNVPPAGGVGWTAGVAPGASGDQQQFDVTWRTTVAQLQGGIRGEHNAATAWLGASGSLIALGKEVAATNRVDDAFAVVDTAGHAGVPVLFENQFVGRTNERGRLLVPWVSAYHATTFAIDPLGLPPGVRVPRVDQQFAVRRRSGAVVLFPLTDARAALVTLVDESGQPLAPGLAVTHIESNRPSVVGWGGQVYFEDLGDRNQLRVAFPDGRSCTAAFTLTATRGETARVGPLTCR